ncbi:hypothetical protein [Micromonospora sp. NPDC005806]|uniref:hypothetical protein n=1 Tax=Micromonospora sp. NPDC005806 TaxID=3364234 RepID=UPI003679CA21
MSTVRLPVPAHTAESLQWLAPAPLWPDGGVGRAARDLVEPWIAELRSDRFVDDFRAALPGGLAATQPPATGGPYRLFQPLSMRYYLVAATLVCRRPGIPDHRVSAGERAFFVMRQVDASGAEHGLVDGAWLPAGATELLPGELEHPMHPASVPGFAAPGTTAAALGMAAGQPSTRSVFYGYIPVAARDAMVPPIADPGAALKQLQDTMSFPNPKEHPAIVELIGRVVDPWTRLTLAPAGSDIGYASLYLLLDLLDWLRVNVPAVFDAITEGGALTPGSAARALFDGIHAVRVPTSGGTVDLDAALAAVASFLSLLTGADDPGPATSYDLKTAARTADWLQPAKKPASLAGLALAAVLEIGDPYRVPPELQGLIKGDPVDAVQPGDNQAYVIRVVLDHPPCRPVLSAPTHPFELARPLDPDAPARPVLIQLPDVNHLRSFNRGVAIEMPPSLRALLDRVTPEMMKGDGLGPSTGLQLGMICSFSLQIIMLVAFIVMFIFLILLNIVFWWLPFLKICFPVPVRPATPNGPTP